MNDYQEFDQKVTAILNRENTGSVLRIEIPAGIMKNAHPGKTAKQLEAAFEGFKFEEYELKVN